MDRPGRVRFSIVEDALENPIVGQLYNGSHVIAQSAGPGVGSPRRKVASPATLRDKRFTRSIKRISGRNDDILPEALVGAAETVPLVEGRRRLVIILDNEGVVDLQPIARRIIQFHQPAPTLFSG